MGKLDGCNSWSLALLWAKTVSNVVLKKANEGYIRLIVGSAFIIPFYIVRWFREKFVPLQPEIAM